MQEKELPSSGQVGWMECTEEMPVPPHLHSLFEKATAKRSKAEQKAINQLLNSFPNVFSKDKFDLGKTHLVEHHIQTVDAAPVKLQPRHIPLAFTDEDQKELEKLTEWGVIQPLASTLGYGLETVLSTKNVPGLVAVKCSKQGCGLPNTQDCMDAVAGATIFSMMDITAAHHQIPVAVRIF